MKKRSFLVSIGLCAMLLSSVMLSGCSQKSAAAAEPSKDDTTVTVETMKVQTGSIQSEYVYSGKVTPKDTADIISQVPGIVAKVNYKVGDRVKKGDVLFTIDTKDTQNSVDACEAQLRASEAQVASAKTALELANGATMQTQIQAAKTALQKAELDLKDVQNTYDQNKQLLAAGIISQNDMNKTELALNNAKITYNQAKQNYDITVNKMPSENVKRTRDALTAAQAGRDAAAVQLASAKKKLEDAAVKSPIDGLVTQCNAVEGTMLSQSGPAFVVINSATVDISVSVSEQIVNKLAPGQSVSVKIGAASDSPLTGVIHTVSPAAGQNGTYDIEIEMNNADNKLKSGMFGEVHFVKQKKDNVVVLPRDVVISSDDDNYVFTISAGKAKKVEVKLGIDTGSEVEVVSGLSANNEIVTKGQNFLKDGSTVKVVTEQAPSASSKGA